MSKGPAQYLLVSLPTHISPSRDKEEALEALENSIQSDYGTTYEFRIPEFKIGTVDALIGQADELSKLSQTCEGVVAKVSDSLRGILDGDEEKIQQQKTVNDKPVENYLRTFTWNKAKYRADKSVAELIDLLQKDIASLDNDVRSKFNQYNQIRTNLTASQRKQTGNLATKSLISVIDPKDIVDTEHLETHLIAVPNQQIKEYLKSYESLCPMVVPRSSQQVAKDDEFTLFSVVTFKKHSAEFVHKSRERRWTPRDFKFKEGGKEEERKEVERLGAEERKVWGEALRLGSTGYSEAAMVWIHVLALRVFVETVLRYGLPLEYVCGLIQTTPKLVKKAKASLDARYSYLAGNALGRDKKGRVTHDESSLQSDMQAAGQGGGDYTAYVYYEFEVI